MSRMGRAVLWVQENGLEEDPNALRKYLEHLEKEKDVRSKDIRPKEKEKTRDNS